MTEFHGKSHTKIHKAWVGMIGRCENVKSPDYVRYGGRGIKVCAEWRKSFLAFAEHVGPPPSSNHSLDRWPDNDGDYRPGNVRWATKSQQGRNRRSNVLFEYNGKRMCVKELAEIAGLKYSTIYARLHVQGWTLEAAISTPLNGRIS